MDETGVTPSGVPVGRALRRGWWLVVLTVLAAGAAGLYLSARQEVQYANSAKLLISPLSQAEGQHLGIDFLRSAGDAARTAQTAAVLVESTEVAEAAARELGDEWTAEKVLEAVEVTPERESNVLSVQATTDDPAAAGRVADAMAASAAKVREQRVRRQVDNRLDRLRKELRGIDTEDYAGRDNVLDELQDLNQVRENPGMSLSVVGTSSSRSEAIRAPVAVVVGLALLAGLVVGVIAAVVLDLLRPLRPEAAAAVRRDGLHPASTSR